MTLQYKRVSESGIGEACEERTSDEGGTIRNQGREEKGQTGKALSL